MDKTDTTYTRMKIMLNLLALITIATAEPTPALGFLKAGTYKLTAQMFPAVRKCASGQNCVISAFSAMLPLGQLALASVGPSHDDILEAISLPNDTMVKESFHAFTTGLRSLKVELVQSNKVFVRNGYALTNEIINDLRTNFDTEIQNVDLAKISDAADKINLWIENHTNKRIRDMIDFDSITSATTASIVNTIYFKGKWVNGFEAVNTINQRFHLSNTFVPMMHQLATFKYGDSYELDAKFLELPYRGNELKLLLVLPKKTDEINSLTEKLKYPGNFSKGLETMAFTTVYIALPKFIIETKTNLKQVLKQVNIEKLFNRSMAHVDKLVIGEQHLYVKDAIQEAYIEVNEVGTRAAAANAAGRCRECEEASYTAESVNEGTRMFSLDNSHQLFNANHPFLFYLLDKNNMILLSGVFNRPGSLS